MLSLSTAKRMAGLRWAAAAVLSMGLGAGGAIAQSTDQQIDEMQKQLDMNAQPDMAALGFQDDLATIEQCQSDCRPLIEEMMKKYKGGAAFGANAKLGASDIDQLAAAIGSAAATLSKEQAADVAKQVEAEFGADAATAYQGSYASTTAPYAPK